MSLSLKNRTQWGWIDIEQALDVVGSARELLNMVRGPSLSSPRRRSSARNRKSRLSSSSGTASEAFEDDRHLLSLDTLLGGDDEEEEFIDEAADEEEREIIFKRLSLKDAMRFKSLAAYSPAHEKQPKSARSSPHSARARHLPPPSPNANNNKVRLSVLEARRAEREGRNGELSELLSLPTMARLEHPRRHDARIWVRRHRRASVRSPLPPRPHGRLGHAAIATAHANASRRLPSADASYDLFTEVASRQASIDSRSALRRRSTLSSAMRASVRRCPFVTLPAQGPFMSQRATGKSAPHVRIGDTISGLMVRAQPTRQGKQAWRAISASSPRAPSGRWRRRHASSSCQQQSTAARRERALGRIRSSRGQAADRRTLRLRAKGLADLGRRLQAGGAGRQPDHYPLEPSCTAAVGATATNRARTRRSTTTSRRGGGSRSVGRRRRRCSRHLRRRG